MKEFKSQKGDKWSRNWIFKICLAQEGSHETHGTRRTGMIQP